MAHRGLAPALPFVLAFAWAGAAHGAEEKPEERKMSREEIVAWLDARALPGSKDVGRVEQPPEAPPQAPRHHGVVLEAAVGALGQLGALKNISPTAPWFHAQLGFEPFKWLMLFGEGDLAFTSSSYGRPPPEPRAFVLYGFGAGVRFTVKPTDRFGAFIQADIGTARVSEDVLENYGYRDSTDFNTYFGGMLGLEWYQASRHFALSVQGGLRDYSKGLARERSGQAPLTWIGAAAIRYTF